VAPEGSQVLYGAIPDPGASVAILKGEQVIDRMDLTVVESHPEIRLFAIQVPDEAQAERLQILSSDGQVLIEQSIVPRVRRAAPTG